MKKVFFMVIINWWLCAELNAQAWMPLLGGLDFQARVLHSDSITNKLFVGGNFGSVDGHQALGIAAWNGILWDTLGGGLPNIVRSITGFQNYVYVGGDFIYLNSPNTGLVNGFTRWNGFSFDSVGTFQNDNNGILQLFEHNNLLYCIGGFDSVNHIHSPMITSWDGNNIFPIGFPNWASGYMLGCFFQNELYIAGNFYDSSGTLYGFAKWNGTNWIQIGTVGGFVGSMVVYNNELYIGGNYLTGPSSHLVKYDGTNFSAVGNDIHGAIFNLRIIDDKLFAVGTIDTAGVVPVSNIAVWDGNNWSAFSNDTFDQTVSDIAVFNGEMYVTGGFRYINSDTVNYIAKYDGWHLGEELPAKRNKDIVKIYPDPVSDNLILEFSYADAEIKYLSIYNLLGKKVLEANFDSQKYSVDVSGLADGLYIAEVRNSKTILRKKIIKE